jgi:hypothetical protein
MATRIQLRRDIEDDWFRDNPILRSGEIGISLDLNTFKIGDGQTPWRDLSYALSGTLSEYIPLNQKSVSGGVASLDSDGKVPDSQIPAGIARDSEVSSAITAAINNLIDGAPGALNTLNELAFAINDDANYAAAITTALAAKANLSDVTAAALAAATDSTAKVAAEAALRVSGDAASVSTAATDATTKANAAQAAAISAAATDSTTKANAAQSAAISAAESDATTKANAAQAAAISAAASDATTKANAAQSAAISAAASDATTKANAAQESANLAADTKISTAIAALTKSSVGLGNVDNTADESKPVSIAQAQAIATAKSEAIADATSQVNAVIASAPAALNTLDELAAALGDDASFAATITSSLTSKAPIASPTFTGTVGGITKSMVGLANVDNTSDLNKPISSLTQTALDAKGNKLIETNAQAGSYSILASDAFKLIEMSGGGTLTIVDSLSFPTGTTIEVLQTTDSQVTIAGSGFIPNSTPGLKLRARWSSATLLKRGTNSWVVMGDLSA